MRIKTGGSIRTWGQWVDQTRQMQQAKERAIVWARPQQQSPMLPLNGNVVGGPLDGARMPSGTREGLKYEWDGLRWKHAQ